MSSASTDPAPPTLKPPPPHLPDRQQQRSDPLQRQDSSPGPLLPPPLLHGGICSDWEGDNYSSSSSSRSIITHEDYAAGARQQKADPPHPDSTDPLTTYWTDDKHRSYLTFMEENFVKDMYEREYCAVDVCGHGAYPESRNTVTHHQPSNILEFKSWRDGDWQRRRRSLPKHLMPWALFQNPWISHFRHSASSHVVPAHSPTASKTLKNPKTFPLNLSENEEVESRPSDEAPNLITQRNSHNQDASSIPINNNSENQDASGNMMDSWNHQAFSSETQCHETQDASGNMMVTLNHQAFSSKTQCHASFVKPRKRNLLPDSKQWRVSTRQKFGDDGHLPISG